MFKRFGFNTSTVGHTTLKVLAGVTLMYAEKGDKMVLLPFTLEVLVVMTVYGLYLRPIGSPTVALQRTYFEP